METQSQEFCSGRVLATPEAYQLLADPHSGLDQKAVLEEVLRLALCPSRRDRGFAGALFKGTPLRVIALWGREEGEENLFVLSVNFFMDYETRQQVRQGLHNYLPLPLT